MQPKLAHRIDIELAMSRSESFANLVAETEYLGSLLPPP
jgi:hypothetical protein